MRNRKLAALPACAAALLVGFWTWNGANLGLPPLGSSLLGPPPAAAQSAAAAPGAALYDTVVYTAAGMPEKMDILAPSPPTKVPSSPTKSAKDPAPVILCIHGGAWSGGDRTEMYNAMTWLQARGYCTCTIDYRLAPASPFPAQIQDCKCAVRYLRAHAAELHIDPDRIGVFGISAGAHLALLLGLTPGQSPGLEGTGGWNSEPSKVQSVIALCGPTDFTHWKDSPTVAPETRSILENFFGGPYEERLALAAEASPITYVRKGEPPILLMHGDQDTLVPLAQSQELYERLKADGNDVTLKVAQGVGHGSYNVFITPDNVTLAQDFYARTLQKSK